MFRSSNHHMRERQKCLQLLELSENPTEDEIKKAFRKQALRYHPDKNPSPDAKEKFQQIHGAYKFLTEGDNFLEQQMEDNNSDFFWIFQFMFPWLFGERPQGPSFFQRPDFNSFYGYSSDESYEESYSPPRGAYSNSHFSRPSASSNAWNSSTSQQNRSNFENFYGQDSDESRQNASDGRTFYSRNYREPTPSGSWERPSESGASQHFRMYANFSETSHNPGDFYQDYSKSAKKKRKDAKKARKEDADERKSFYAERGNYFGANAQARPSSSQNQSQRSQTSGQSQSRPAEKNPPPPIRVEKGYNKPVQREERKTKKEMQQEQKRREKEIKEIREELERQQREEKEKLEKKKKAQEEKERVEREKREEEERIERERREEEERKLEEQKRIQRERDEKLRQERMKREKERREKERAQQEKQKKINDLMAEFDRVNLLDDNGEFKVTDSDVINLIRRDDLNQFRHADNDKTNIETINGFKTKDLIELQRAANQAQSIGRGSGEDSIRNLIQDESNFTQHKADPPRPPTAEQSPWGPPARETRDKKSWSGNHHLPHSVGQQQQNASISGWSQVQQQQYQGHQQYVPLQQYQEQQQQQQHLFHTMTSQQQPQAGSSGWPQNQPYQQQASQQPVPPPQYHHHQQQQQQRGVGSFKRSSGNQQTPTAAPAADPGDTRLGTGQPVFQFPPPLQPLNHRGLPRRGPQLPRARPQRLASVNSFANPFEQPVLTNSVWVANAPSS